jgi:hypothetical protein
MCGLLKVEVKSPSNRILEAASCNLTFNLLCLICFGFRRDTAVSVSASLSIPTCSSRWEQPMCARALED